MRMRDALVHLAKGGVDIVLLDMGLPDGHGLDTVRRARAVASDVPLIVLTGLDDEALAAEAMKEAITKRIREKLTRSDEILQADLTFLTCYWTLPPVQRNVDESMESFVEKVAAKIQESIDERSSSRMVKI